MPKRSNPFQRLVLLIEHQLWPEAELTESAEIGGREIDILIEHAAGGIDFRIAVECRDYSNRSQTREWVDQLIGKYSPEPSQETIPAAHKVIAVSSSGFSDGAYEKARSSNLGLELLTLNEAESSDWGDFELLTKEVPVRRILLSPLTHIDLNPTPSNPHSAALLQARGKPDPHDLQVNTEGGEIELLDFLIGILQDESCPPYIIHQVKYRLKPNSLPSGNVYTNLKVPFSEIDVEVTDSKGAKYDLNSVRYYFECCVEKEMVNLSESTYRNTRILTCNEEVFGRELYITLSEEKEEKVVKLSSMTEFGNNTYAIVEKDDIQMEKGDLSVNLFVTSEEAKDMSPPRMGGLPDHLKQS